jgi:hypothetical protein
VGACYKQQRLQQPKDCGQVLPRDHLPNDCQNVLMVKHFHDVGFGKKTAKRRERESAGNKSAVGTHHNHVWVEQRHQILNGSLGSASEK